MTKEEWDDFLYNLAFWGKFFGGVGVAALVAGMFFL